MPNEKNRTPTTTDHPAAMDPVARHNARHYAMQAMYQWQLTGKPLKEIETEFLHYHITKKFDLDYFKELIHGVPEHQEMIDQEMETFIERPLDEIDAIELAVLRLAIYELMKRPDVPYRVVINEALELNKKFGSIEGHKFVNGILDKVAKKNRTAEK